MDRPRWQEIESLFERLIEVSPAERRRILASEAPDLETRAEVTSLLEAHEAADGFLEDPAFCDRAPEDEAVAALRDTDHIGPYRLGRVLGVGGMGIVIEAERDEPRRRVALKIMRDGRWVSDLQVRLFRQEIAALARLSHADIARIYDAGRTDHGQHYFTMELVEGAPLDRYAQEHHLGLEARLALVERVARAVHHAHQRGVIHCDLKPSNVVVSGDPGSPALKILDFGLARLQAEDGPAREFTVTATLRGSLPYMSPEQARAGGEVLDVRTDVWSLGIVLHQLATGQLPHDLSGRPPLEAARIIADEPPRAPGRGVPAELATIIGHCLERDPERRYASAAALAEDLRRFRAREPILARPPGSLYQLRKLIERHRLAALACALIVAALTAFAIHSKNQARRFEEQRDAARRQRELTERVVRWWGSRVLGSLRPRSAHDPLPAMRTVLHACARDIPDEFGEVPRVAGTIHHLFGNLFRSLGDPTASHHHLERALTLRRAELGERHPDTLSSLNNLAVACTNLGRLEEAEALYREVIEARRATLEPEDPRLLTSLSNLGWFYTDSGRLDEAAPILADVLARRRRVLGEDHPDVMTSTNNLASLFVRQDRVEEAEPLLEAVLQSRRRIYPPHHARVLGSQCNLAKVRIQRGLFDEAERLLEDARRIAVEALTERHPTTLSILDALATLHHRQGSHTAARAFSERALEIREEVLGLAHQDTLTSTRHLANLLKDSGDHDEAERLYRRALVIHRRQGRYEDPSFLSTIQNLGVLYGDSGRPERAEKLLTEMLAEMDEALPAEHPNRLLLEGTLGRLHVLMERHEEAEARLVRTLERQEATLGPDHQFTLMTREYLAVLYRATQRPELARPLCERTLETLRRRYSPHSPHALAALNTLAGVRQDLGHHEAARRLYAELAEAFRAVAREKPEYLATALRRQATSERASQRWSEAEALLLQIHELPGRGALLEDARREAARDLAELYDQLDRPEDAKRWRRPPER